MKERGHPGGAGAGVGAQSRLPARTPSPSLSWTSDGQLSMPAGRGQSPCQAQPSSAEALCHPTLAGALATGVGCPGGLGSLLAASQMPHSCKGGRAGREKPPVLPEGTQPPLSMVLDCGAPQVRVPWSPAHADSHGDISLNVHELDPLARTQGP